jgi:hypothetical protein
MRSLSSTKARLLAATLSACSAALVVAACASQPSATSPSSNVASPAATSGGASPPATAQPAAGSPTGSSQSGAVQTGTAPCATSALHASIPSGAAAASGHYGYPVNLTNASGSPCTLYGYPGVSFVSSPGGSQVGAAAIRATTAYIYLAQDPHTITLAPGQTTHADLQLITTGVFTTAQCGPATVQWVRVYPPDQSAPLYVNLTAQTCSKGQDMLTVSPVQPVGAPNP